MLRFVRAKTWFFGIILCIYQSGRSRTQIFHPTLSKIPTLLGWRVSRKRFLQCTLFEWTLYLSIPQYTGSLGNRFQETHGTKIYYSFLFSEWVNCKQTYLVSDRWSRYSINDNQPSYLLNHTEIICRVTFLNCCFFNPR